MRQSLLNRMRRVEASVPVRCGHCGRVLTVDRAHTTLLLFRFEGRLMRGDGTVIAEEDLRPCPGCRLPKERCGKIIEGVDPAMLLGL